MMKMLVCDTRRHAGSHRAKARSNTLRMLADISAAAAEVLAIVLWWAAKAWMEELPRDWVRRKQSCLPQQSALHLW
jgi:hypothetical protein